MNLLHDLQNEIRRYLDGAVGLKALDRWLAARVQSVNDAGDPELLDLYYFTWTQIDFWMTGDSDEVAVRAELAEVRPLFTLRRVVFSHPPTSLLVLPGS